MQVAPGPKRGSGQDTLAVQLPADSAPPTPISSFWCIWLPGQWGLEGGSVGCWMGTDREEGGK